MKTYGIAFLVLGIILLIKYFLFITFAKVEIIMAVFPNQLVHYAYIITILSITFGGLALFGQAKRENIKLESFKIYKQKKEENSK